MAWAKTALSSSVQQQAIHFGALVKSLRSRQGLRQRDVLAHLPGWTQANYSRVENGEQAPPFDQLYTIYSALHATGVELHAQDRQQFLTLARVRIEVKKSHLDRKSDQEWDALRLTLSQFDHTLVEQMPPSRERLLSRPHLMETRHLAGRDDWLASVVTELAGAFPKKLLVLRGPTGIGKSSELHRLARHFLTAEPHPHVVLCVLPGVGHHSEPENALDQLLGSLLVEVGPPDTAIQKAILTVRIAYVLACLQKATTPVLILVDNAEHVLDEQGQLASCWQQFLTQLLRSQAHASLVLATKEWPGWYGGEGLFVSERSIPPLTVDESVHVLERLGLASVPAAYLHQASERAGGIPLYLEWIVTLAKKPPLLDSWDDLDELSDADDDASAEVLTRRLMRLLEAETLVHGDIVTRLHPMLDRILHQRLSEEALKVLHILSLATVPLGKPPLQRLCLRPSVLKELRTVSLLTAHSQRVQVLPLVAAVVREQLSAEQQQVYEEQLIAAYQHWLGEGVLSEREMGAVIAELATLSLRHHRLLDAAELLIRYGWLSFNQGHGPRLARFAQRTMQHFDWHGTLENACGGLILLHLLAPFLGKAPDDEKRAQDYQRIQQAVLSKEVSLRPSTDLHLTHYLVIAAMQAARFAEAQALLDACSARLQTQQLSHPDIQASLVEKRAWFLSKWGEDAEERGVRLQAQARREQVIALYKEGIALLLTSHQQVSSLESSMVKKRLARFLNNLGYQLNRMGQHEEALQYIEQSLTLREQGYVQIGELASSYSEKAQALAGLGRFQEALRVDEQAQAEVRRGANTGNAVLQEDLWIYLVNRGRLYLRVGRRDEAEQCLREALGSMPTKTRRRNYQMAANDALAEIAQGRQRSVLPHHQLDWRWVERYRELGAYDAYWWWAQAGPFTQQEQEQWHRLSRLPLDEATREPLGKLIAQSRQRELTTALAEEREPRLHYPALAIDEVRRRIAGMLDLDAEIGQQEPNAVVRRLYHAAIAEEVCFLRMIEATDAQDTHRFQEYNQCADPVPTREEMMHALSYLRAVLQQGLLSPQTREISQRVLQFLQEQLQLSADLFAEKAAVRQQPPDAPLPDSGSQQLISAQAAKRFFEAIFHEYGYEGWQVVIDPQASGSYVESASRLLFLHDRPLALERVKYYLEHEFASHVARSVAGERSLLGLLAIGTKGYLPIEEGLALFHERRAASLHHQPYNHWGIWIGTLATGLASGVVTPAQTFLSLYRLLELLFLLRRLLEHPDATREQAQEKARQMALARCLRTYRGVPNLEEAGICFGKDAAYLRGLLLVERAVAEDGTVLDRLAVGRVGLEQLPDVQELGIVAPPQTLRKLLLDPDLDSYILSFQRREEPSERPG